MLEQFVGVVKEITAFVVLLTMFGLLIMSAPLLLCAWLLAEVYEQLKGWRGFGS